MLEVPFDTFLTYFDNQAGPTILFSSNKALEHSPKFQSFDITHLMDIHKTGDFFLHYYNNSILINYCSIIKDERTRSGEHSFMTTILVDTSHLSKEDVLMKVFGKMTEIEQNIKLINESLIKLDLVKKLVHANTSSDYEQEKMHLQNNLALMNCLKRNI
jgi:hypothetical protein